MCEKFTVLADNSSLRWLMEISDPSGRLMRWRLRLTENDFDVRYKKGTGNLCADFASRMHTESPIEDDDDHDEIPCYYTTEADSTGDEPSDVIELEFVFLTRSREL